MDRFSTKKEDGIGNIYEKTGYLTEQMLWETHIRLLLGWPPISTFRSVIRTMDELSVALHIPTKELVERMALGVHEVRTREEEK